MVDEKWFSTKKKGQKYILADGEELPVQKAKHKSHIKVMFLTVVGRLRRDAHNNRNFSGKFIFPLTRQVQTQRNSRHRAVGMMVTRKWWGRTRKPTRRVC